MSFSVKAETQAECEAKSMDFNYFTDSCTVRAVGSVTIPVPASESTCIASGGVYAAATGECKSISGATGGVQDLSASPKTGVQDPSASPKAGVQDPSSTSNGIYWPKVGLPENTVAGVLQTVLSWMLGIFGMLALAGFIISGVQYLMAAGSDTMIETAKKNMTFSIVGVIVALSGFVIVKAIDMALRGTSGLF